MSDARRLARAERVVELRAKVAEAAQRELAAAEGELRARVMARDAVDQAMKRAGEALGSGVARAEDWSDAESHLRALSTGLERAAVAIREAERDVEDRRGALVEARRALRTMEMWRDGILAAMREAAAKIDRARTDEAAARATRR
jgi:flagellar export protein FliJ